MHKILCSLGLHTKMLVWYDHKGRHCLCRYCDEEHHWLKEFPRATRLWFALRDMGRCLKDVWKGD